MLFLTMVATFVIAITQQNVEGESALLASGSNNSTDSKSGNIIISSFGTETKEKEEKEKKNIQTVMQLKDAINTGDVSRVDE